MTNDEITNEITEDALEEGAVVEDVAEQLSKGYAGYLIADNSGPVALLEDEIENLLKQMDEFYTTLHGVQETNTEVLSTMLPFFLQNVTKLQSLYTQIDTLSSAVNKVSHNMAQLESAADLIERQIDSGPIRKVFGFFSKPEEPVEVVIPEVYKTEEEFC